MCQSNRRIIETMKSYCFFTKIHRYAAQW